MTISPLSSFRWHHEDSRSYLRRGCDLALSVFREIVYASSIPRNYLASKRTYHRCGEKIEWEKESRGLFVLVHGLRAHPSIWHPQMDLLKQHKGIDVFIPFVPHRGNCSLEEAASPILSTIVDYTKSHPGRPICLLGVSNGGRLVTWMETQLRDLAPSSAVKVSAIAGVHLGSPVVNWMERWGVAPFFLKPVIRRELASGCPRALALMEDLRKPLAEGVAPREYELYGTTEDLHIPDLCSSLPKLNLGERVHIIHGQGHSSIVSAVAHQQIASCLSWIERVSTK